MIKRIVILLFIFGMYANGQTTVVHGQVTYLAAGSVYTSFGRDSGISDSLRVRVFRGIETVAIIQVFAVSSKSSVCRIVESRKVIHVGDSVKAEIIQEVAEQTKPKVVADTLSTTQHTIKQSQLPSISVRTPSSPIRLRGRIGLQYNTTYFDNAGLSFQQPGVIVNVRGEASELPLKFEMYGTLRATGRNGAGPFSSAGTNDSRIYRLAMEYEHQNTIYSFGRILPIYASSIGYVDGASVARRMGKIIAGASVGFQPSTSLQMPSAENKKVSLFGQYQANDSWNNTAGAAYARIWSSLGIEREVLSATWNMYSPAGFSAFASSDIDLRSLSQGSNIWDPALSLFLCSVYYRFSEIITAGVSVDASRPVYSLASTQSIADSLLDKKLRSGISLNLNVSIFRGAGLYNTYTSRFSDEGFGKEYSNSSQFYFMNIAGTGIMSRLNFLLNETVMVHSQGYGIQLQRNLIGIDCALRYQQNQSEIRQQGTRNTFTTIGFDAAALLSHQLTLMSSIDLYRGEGTNSNSLFFELSWRF